MSYYVKKPLGTKIIVKSHFVVPWDNNRLISIKS